MNEQDIDEMEAGRELDVLVAEHVMGQQDFSHPGFFWTEGTTEDGSDGWDGFYCPRCSLRGSPDQKRSAPPKCVRHYSTNIDAAWQVHKKACGFLFSRRMYYLNGLATEVRKGHHESIAWPD